MISCYMNCYMAVDAHELAVAIVIAFGMIAVAIVVSAILKRK